MVGERSQWPVFAHSSRTDWARTGARLRLCLSAHIPQAARRAWGAFLAAPRLPLILSLPSRLGSKVAPDGCTRPRSRRLMMEHDSAALAEHLRALERRPRANPDEELFDQGLAFDLETLLDRRGMLKLVGAASLGAGLLLAGCPPRARGARRRQEVPPAEAPGRRAVLPSPRRRRGRTRPTAQTARTCSTKAASSAATSDRASVSFQALLRVSR